MTFAQALEVRGYTVENNNKDKKLIIIKRDVEGTECKKYIFIDMTCKTVEGFLVPKKLIKDLGQINNYTFEYNDLYADIRFFAEEANYSIINS